MRRFRTRLRRLTVLAVTALSFLFGRLADTDHLLNTAHVVCQEHGGQIEEVAVSAPRAEGIHEANGLPGRHHACDMPAAFAGSGAALVPRIGGVNFDLAVEGAPSPVHAASPSRAPVTQLALAPKQGPPQG